MVTDEKTLILEQNNPKFADYKVKLLKAILGFFANLTCFPEFVTCTVTAEPNLVYLLCQCANVDSEEIWHRALYIVDEVKCHVPEMKKDVKEVQDAFKKVSAKA